MENVIILGTGCAGLTAAIYCARANLKPLVIEGVLPGGQLTTTSEVENYPGFPEGIDGYTIMNQMRIQAERFGSRYINDNIKSVDFSRSVKKLNSENNSYKSNSIIIATGASPRMLGIPGENEMFGGKGVTTCATCDGAFYQDMEVSVVGGGDSACEEALFLTRFCSKIYLIHRRDELRASKIMVDRTLAHKKIFPIWDSQVEAVLPDNEGNVRGIQLLSKKTGKMSEVLCKGVFIAIGHIPNTKPFHNSLTLDEAGYIVPKAGSQVKTHIPGIYVAGDCSDHIYRQAITAAGMGCQAAIETERWLAQQ